MLASLLLPVLVAAQAAPSVPGVPTAAVAAAHVQDCVAAAGRGRVDVGLLQQRGWRAAEITMGKEKRQAPFAVLSKPDDMSVLMAMVSGPEAGSCILLLPTPTAEEAEAFRMAMGAGKGRASWATASHRLSIVPIGNAKAQGLRVTVRALDSR